GIFVVERGTLFIAIPKKLGTERTTSFKRDEATTLFVLKRAVRAIPPKAADEPVGGVPQPDTPEVSGKVIVHGILESIDAKKSTITIKGVSGNDASSVMRLLALTKTPAERSYREAVSAELLKSINPDNSPKLVNVPVRANADGVIGTGVGFAKLKLKMEDLNAGQVVQLQLATDRKTGFVIVFVRVVSVDKAPGP